MATKDKQHADLSASGASRWVACPGSRAAQDGLPNPSNPAAREGTVIHWLSEEHLRGTKGFEDLYDKVGLTAEADGKVVDITEEMVELAYQYINWVKESFIDNQDRELLHIEYEQRVNFETWVREGFGTADLITVYVEDGLTILHVADLKTGRGEVLANNNLQGILYALGAYDNLLWQWTDYDEIRISIFAPRQGGEDTWALSQEDLMQHGEIIRSAAEEAFSEGARRVAGPQCDYCLARPTCKTAARHALETARFDFDDDFSKVEATDETVPTGLNLDQIAEILPHLDTIEAWIKVVRDYAYAQAMQGHAVRGFKLIQGRAGARSWASEMDAEGTLMAEGYDMEDIYEQKLISPTKAEKLLGKVKAAELLTDELVLRPEGKPKLVAENAKGKEYIPDPTKDFDDL